MVDCSWVEDDCVFASNEKLFVCVETVVSDWDFENVIVDVSHDMDWFGMADSVDDSVSMEGAWMLLVEGSLGDGWDRIDAGCEDTIWGKVSVSWDVSCPCNVVGSRLDV